MPSLPGFLTTAPSVGFPTTTRRLTDLLVRLTELTGNYCHYLVFFTGKEHKLEPDTGRHTYRDLEGFQM